MTAPTANPAPEACLQQLGLALPAPPQPRGHYAPFCNVPLGAGQWISVSGQTCRVNGEAIRGICHGPDDLEAARDAAQVAMLNSLAALRAACGGSLPPSCQVVRLRGFVRASPGFTGHTAVLDAASALLQSIFPQHPLPARTAVGASSLPDGAWVEIELDAFVG